MAENWSSLTYISESLTIEYYNHLSKGLDIEYSCYVG
jgi:hypothetical protein